LKAPIGLGIAQALDIDATREASLDGCLHQLRSKERQRGRQIDLPFGALSAPYCCQGVDNVADSVDRPVGFSETASWVL
jgi:hypothetical protein